METQHIAASTYVQITREELEEWLNNIGYRGKWERDGKTAGVYLISLSDSVAIKLSSTIGSTDDAMGRGQASMQLALVSKITGRVVNKKAQGQSHFARTKGWMTNWERGVDTMKRAYMPSSDFYDAIAAIPDRDKYKQDVLAKIEQVPGWGANNYFINLHQKVEKDGVLMPADWRALEGGLKRQAPKENPQATPPSDPQQEPITKREEVQQTINFNEQKVQSLRDLYVAAKRSGDEWTQNFAVSIGQQLKSGRNLSAPQILLVKKKLDIFRVPSNGKPASDLF